MFSERLSGKMINIVDSDSCCDNTFSVSLLCGIVWKPPRAGSVLNSGDLNFSGKSDICSSVNLIIFTLYHILRWLFSLSKSVSKSFTVVGKQC